ncbi:MULTISPECIES: hypothetical protein [Vallitalea]|uniref:Uncharacterized protein n=1 Tax=Vallitalea maricola TaxID=3074433 RepID=A0ACB5UEU6_9FIRM|nr:hypothetical protein [Vallitalea guaymasensis]GMQ61177.1 hypothetical protein AN2V17_04050 [Vallitalea sp. AN17-2]
MNIKKGTRTVKGKPVFQYNKPLNAFTDAELTKELAKRHNVTCYRTHNTYSVKANGKRTTGNGKAVILVVR